MYRSGAGILLVKNTSFKTCVLLGLILFVLVSTYLQFSGPTWQQSCNCPRDDHIVIVSNATQRIGLYDRHVRLHTRPLLNTPMSNDIQTTSDGSQIGLDCNPRFRNTTDLPVEMNILSKRLVGRLGNKLFQFASTYAIARDNDMIPMVFNSKEFLKCFPTLNVAINIDGKPSNKWPKAREREAMQYDERFSYMFSNDTSIHLQGYLQSWRYFYHRKNEIRSQLTFERGLQENADNFLHSVVREHVIANAIRGKGKNVSSLPEIIAIHVRRGDFTQGHFAELGYKVADASYFRKAMNQMAERFKNVVFIVASDNITWSRLNIASEKYTVAYSPYVSMYEDMCLLASCNHTIMSTGTYSWWAAWLANGYTVYPNNYPDPNTWLGKQCIKEDYYLPTWNAL